MDAYSTVVGTENLKQPEQQGAEQHEGGQADSSQALEDLAKLSYAFWT